MKTIAVTGASGLIGTAFCELARSAGYDVVPLARVAKPSAQTPGWNVQSGEFVLPANARADILVHLAGENVAGRWTSSKKQAIARSRIDATTKLAQFISKMESPPESFICASATGIYGNRGDETLDETAMAGRGFLAAVATRWEDAARPARAAGIRVVHCRLGVVLSARGGALAVMRVPFALGLGGAMGNGKQWMSWIALEDAARALLFAVENQTVSGAMNVVAPAPATNRDFARALAGQLRRPAVFTVPAWALRLVLGEAADGMLLFSSRAIPAKLQDKGFQWRFGTLASALREELEK